MQKSDIWTTRQTHNANWSLLLQPQCCFGNTQRCGDSQLTTWLAFGFWLSGCLGVYAIFTLFSTLFFARCVALYGKSIKSGLSFMLPVICMKFLLPLNNCTHTHTLTHIHTCTLYNKNKKLGRLSHAFGKNWEAFSWCLWLCCRLVPLVNTQIQLNLIRLTCCSSLLFLSLSDCRLSLSLRVFVQFVWHLP